jgi:hypothetical protein
MPTYIVQCKQCGKEHAPPPAAIRAGSWRLCADCAPSPAQPSRCRECGRPLAGSRALCLRCLGVAL